MKLTTNRPLHDKNLLIPILFLFLTAATSDLATDRVALLALRAGVHGRPLLWNISASPCSWAGVHCESNRVTELRLPGMGLSGPLPLSIGNLTDLQTLSLRYNALSGQIPSDFANLGSIRYIYLQGNSFTGEIPGFLFSLPNLIRLNLAKNNFTGQIPSSVTNSTRLGTLFLQDNQLTGPIPDIQFPLQQFNVSGNNLNGSIPNALSSQPKEVFNGNSLCGKPLNPCPSDVDGGAGGSGGSKKKKLSGGAIAGIVIACLVGLLLILLVLFFCCRKRKGNKSSETHNVATVPKDTPVESHQTDKGGGVVPPVAPENHETRASAASTDSRKSEGNKGLIFFGKSMGSFELDDLLRASAEVLGKGTFGSSYKASFDNGMLVAVKRLRDVIAPEKEFKEKMEVVGSMDHQNLVPLKAYYFSREEKLLVYDYMPRGSLSALLHSNRGAGRTPLSWESRANLALGAARAITYIHSRDATTSHGNIKSSNVLLSESYEARVSDFCLAPVINPTSTPNRIDGYRALEVTDARKISQKADVYSFGILLLELLTGKSPTHPQLNEDGVDLPRWVQSVIEQQSTAEIFDLELVRYQTVEDEMLQLLKVAVSCTAQYPDKRPSMPEVTKLIEEICRSSRQHDSSSPMSPLSG